MTDTSNLATRLVKFSIFSGLDHDPAALEQLASLMSSHTFQMREIIIDEKQPDSRMFFLLSGQISITKMDAQGQIVVIDKADAASSPYFGESALLGKFRKSANVVAYTMCECLSLSAKDFDNFLQSHPAAVALVYRNLASILFDRLARANQDLMIQGLASKR